MGNVDYFLLVLGILGTVAFAVSGALTAIESKLDLFGVLILAVVTACGGGLIRDIMIQKDYAIFTDWYYPLIAGVVGGIVFLIMWFLRNLSWENSKIYLTVFNIVDSIGLGAFVVVGALRANHYGITQGVQIIFYSVITGVGGGLLRDLFVCRIPAIFRKHIYAVAAIIGALYYYFIGLTNMPAFALCLTTVILVVAIRYIAFYFKLSLPKIKLKEQA